MRVNTIMVKMVVGATRRARFEALFGHYDAEIT